jgi:hypothetical protein
MAAPDFARGRSREHGTPIQSQSPLLPLLHLNRPPEPDLDPERLEQALG